MASEISEWITNEAEIVKRVGGKIWRVERPGVTQGDHVSESGLANSWVDAFISNDGDVAALHKAVLAI